MEQDNPIKDKPINTSFYISGHVSKASSHLMVGVRTAEVIGEENILFILSHYLATSPVSLSVFKEAIREAERIQSGSN